MIGRILVGLGGTECTLTATQTAIDFAQRFGASLTGVTIANVAQLQRVGPVPIGGGAAATDLRLHRLSETRNRIEETIVHFGEECVNAGVESRVLREERDEPFDYLISQARYHDVTVLGLHGLFEYGVAGEAEYDPGLSLVRLLQGGVRPLIATTPEPQAIRRVLIAYSGSVASAKTMRRFIQMQLWPEAIIRIATFGTDADRRQRHLHHAVEYCQAHGIVAEPHYEPTDPREGVLGVAHDWGANLIVMGNSNRTLLSRRVLGDTMLKTIRESDVPLFLAQ